MDYLNDLSKQIVPFHKVIVKYSENTWYGELHAWYNKNTNSWWKDCLKPHLPPLKTRKYIQIMSPFMEIHVSSQLKGSPISIDDILFATRGLMVDATRAIDGGYKLLSCQNGVLTIEPDIDNFST